MSTRSVPAAAVGASLRSGRPDIAGVAFQVVLLLCLLFSLAVLAVLLVDIFSKGLPLFFERGGEFLGAPTSARPSRAGVFQGIVGSALIALFVALVAFPIGIMTAIYLEEYASDSRLTRVIAINIRNLAGVPSVVYGLLGLAVFVSVFGRNVLAGGLTMAVLVLPIVIITASEALRAVPGAIREAGYGVGASRWEVTRQLVLPAAAPGILTGTVLSLSRALGETAPLLLAGAVVGYFSSGDRNLLEQFLSSYTTLPVIVFDWARETRAVYRQELAPAAIIVLLVVTLLANALAIFLRNRFERSW